MIWIYNFFLTLGSLFWVPWMIVRSRRRKEPVNWKERTGDYTIKLKKGEPRLWLHAVSVGEVVAALPVLKAVKSLDPSLEIVLSVTTSSGHKTAVERAAGLYDHLVYFPIDVYRFVLSALVRVRPTAFAVMETELWMNFLDAAHNIGVKTLLINGRISDRSYPRSLKLQFFYEDMLKRMDRCLMQSQTDADRIKVLGGQNIEVLGNCKYDEAIEGLDADPNSWRQSLGLSAERSIIVVGSTRSELEEEFVAEALDGLDAQVVWAPRHLERSQNVAELATKHGWKVRMRSDGSSTTNDTAAPTPANNPSLLILDTYGELSSVYSVADVVVIGGGFDDLGGQNVIQPLAHGKPVLHGRHMQNFADVTKAALESGASQCVGSPGELNSAIKKLLSDPDDRKRRGVAAQALVNASRGASMRYAQAIVESVKP